MAGYNINGLDEEEVDAKVTTHSAQTTTAHGITTVGSGVTTATAQSLARDATQAVRRNLDNLTSAGQAVVDARVAAGKSADTAAVSGTAAATVAAGAAAGATASQPGHAHAGVPVPGDITDTHLLTRSGAGWAGTDPATLGGIAAPAAPFNTTNGGIIYDGSVLKAGISDDCTASPILTDWTQNVGVNYSITPDGTKYTWSHTHGAASDPRLYYAVQNRPLAAWSYVKHNSSTNGVYWTIYIAQSALGKYVTSQVWRSAGSWVLSVSENGDQTSATVAGVDAEGWLGILYEPVSGYVRALWSNNAAGANPGIPGNASWAYHTTFKQVAAGDGNVAPVVMFRYLNATGAGTTTGESSGLYAAHL